MFSMKKIFSFFNVVCLTILSILCLTFGLNFSLHSARAETFLGASPAIDSLTNGKFTVVTEASGRKNVTIYNEKVSVTTKTDEEIDYYCYNWRDISYLTFTFSANLTQELDEYAYFKFIAYNAQTEDLTTPTGHMNENKTTLLEGEIVNNTVSIPRFYFYIDSDAQFNEQAKDRAKGTGFGLYRFKFVYAIAQPSSGDEDPIVFEIELGSIFIAILPDDIQSIPLQNLSIRYSVSSSNRLMNVYNLYLSAEDEFKYVNPNFIEWSIIGKDRSNVDYVLSLKMKNSSPAYANYRVVWTSQIDPVGPEFTFDSNNIEGTWKAYCTILNHDGTERVTLTSTELSTIKSPQKALIWIILGSALGVIIVGSIVGLALYRGKKKRSM